MVLIVVHCPVEKIIRHNINENKAHIYIDMVLPVVQCTVNCSVEMPEAQTTASFYSGAGAVMRCVSGSGSGSENPTPNLM
jgi:hypothetical protein